MKMFKRGTVGSGMLFFVFFLMMIMIAGSLVGGTYAFFGKGYDFRSIESKQLFSQIKECFLQNNFFEKGFVQDKSLFFETCKVSQNILESGNYMVYLRKVSDNSEFSVGVYDFKTRCALTSRFKNRSLPRCQSEDIGDYQLIVGSSQTAKRVAL